MKLKDFDKLSKRDFENGAVIDAIRRVFEERDKLKEQIESFIKEADYGMEEGENDSFELGGSFGYSVCIDDLKELVKGE